MDTKTLSNPYLTKAIAASKKKTDKVDAKILTALLRMDPWSELLPDHSTVAKFMQKIPTAWL